MYVARFVKVAASELFVSTPNPSWFGNPPNDGAQNWLTSRFHFNFAEYRGGRGNFGVLRVVNDDYVLARRGFGEHGHADMEIVTYVLEGELTHKDSIGTSETLGRGAVQFMTAGSGVRHSEQNLHSSSPLRFIQTWIMPRARSLPPNYGSTGSGAVVGERLATARDNRWSHLVSDVRNTATTTPVAINQDCNVYVAEISDGSTLRFELGERRQVYVVVVEGSAAVLDAKVHILAALLHSVAVFHRDVVGALQGAPVSLERHSAAEMTGPGVLDLTGRTTSGERCHVMLFEMASV
jgi:redox-sensitive bicupin YhaK (pirin superfamily)